MSVFIVIYFQLKVIYFQLKISYVERWRFIGNAAVSAGYQAGQLQNFTISLLTGVYIHLTVESYPCPIISLSNNLFTPVQ